MARPQCAPVLVQSSKRRCSGLCKTSKRDEMDCSQFHFGVSSHYHCLSTALRLAHVLYLLTVAIMVPGPPLTAGSWFKSNKPLVCPSSWGGCGGRNCGHRNRSLNLLWGRRCHTCIGQGAESPAPSGNVRPVSTGRGVNATEAGGCSCVQRDRQSTVTSKTAPPFPLFPLPNCS